MNRAINSFEYREYLEEEGGPALRYRLFIPERAQPSQKYPLVVFLHGAGERGSDNEKQLTAYKGATIWAEPKNQQKLPCYIMAPQCPEGRQWVDVPFNQGDYDQDKIEMSRMLRLVLEAVADLKKNYNIDENKICITGISMGGYGTWDAITRFPKMFAAAAPVCGCGPVKKAALIAWLPIWAFHGTEDAAVPFADDERIIDAIKKHGGRPAFTIYKGEGHLIWHAAYSQQLVEWVHSRLMGY